MTALNEEWQRMAASAIEHQAFCASQAWQQAAAEYERPSVIYKPRLSIDGDQWCALYGENLQDGVAGFGKSPYEAMHAFDQDWYGKLPDTKHSPSDLTAYGEKVREAAANHIGYHHAKWLPSEAANAIRSMPLPAQSEGEEK